MKGYIYLRDNAWYRAENAIKLGIASNTKERDGTYVTGEIIRGEFIRVFEVPHEEMRRVETWLHTCLKKFHIGDRGGGTEFFKRDIIEMVEPILKSMEFLEFRSLTKAECDLLDRVSRIRHVLRNKLSKKKDRNPSTPKKTPRDYQQEIIDKCITYFGEKDKGLLILTCGVGKTLISLWIAKQLGVKRILIGVPTVVLLEQWLEVIKDIFPNRPLYKIYGKEETCVPDTQRCCIAITTYASSYKLLNCKFDLKILDEAHHLTNKDTDDISSRAFVQILNVESTKQLALTATPKYLESEETNTVSNNNEAQFGQIIHQICLLWAIEHDIVCDYVIQTVIVDSNKIDDVENKRLFLAAYCALKSVANGNSHHMLIYCNDTINSKLIIKYLRMLLSNIFSGLAETMFCSEYNSKMNTDEQMDILQQFHKSRFGIIVCVYCLGEGWNCPLLDAVVFAENMSSNIRILQCALRACRKNGPEKICAKIILPVVDIDTDDATNQDLKMVREVTRQMGLEDVTVISKLKVFREKEREKEENIRSGRKDDDDSFVYDEEITTRLRLKTTPRTTISFESLRKILAGKNIRSIEEYYQLCERDVRFPKNPEKTFQSLNMRWSWVYYLSIPSTFYDLETCKSKCREYLTTYPELRAKYLDICAICADLCKIDPMFPPNGFWVDYYNVNTLQNIIYVAAPILKKRGFHS